MRNGATVECVFMALLSTIGRKKKVKRSKKGEDPFREREVEELVRAMTMTDTPCAANCAQVPPVKS